MEAQVFRKQPIGSIIFDENECHRLIDPKRAMRLKSAQQGELSSDFTVGKSSGRHKPGSKVKLPCKFRRVGYNFNGKYSYGMAWCRAQFNRCLLVTKSEGVRHHRRSRRHHRRSTGFHRFGRSPVPAGDDRFCLPAHRTPRMP